MKQLQFFSSTSHMKIRTPMTLIHCPLEKLLSESSDKQSTYLMMYQCTAHSTSDQPVMDIRKIDKEGTDDQVSKQVF